MSNLTMTVLVGMVARRSAMVTDFNGGAVALQNMLILDIVFKGNIL